MLCSHDTAVAARGAQLWLDGWAPWLIFSGGLGTITRHLWSEPEADQFARIALEMGVPADRILIENQSTNTGENVQFTQRLLAERGLDPGQLHRRAEAVHGAPQLRDVPQGVAGEAARRDVAAGLVRRVPGRYANGALSRDDVISIMVGDLQRIRLYPEQGFQIPQEIPDDVWAAFEELVRLGYDRHLVKATL